MEVIGLLGFLIALAVLIILIVKGMHLSYAAFISVLIIIATNGMPLFATLGDYWGMVGMLASMFLPMFLFGAIFAKVYTDSGAASSLTNAIMDFMAKLAKTDMGLKRISLIAMLGIGILMGYGGMDMIALIFLLIPIFANVLERADIPRRYLPSLVITGVIVSGVGAGAPQQYNMMATSLAGVSGAAGFVPSLIGQIVILISAYLFLMKGIKKAAEAGEHFEWGKLKAVSSNDEKHPNALLSLIPLLCVFLLYNLAHLDLAYSMLVGAVVTILMFFPYFRAKETRFKSITASLNAGVEDAAKPILCLPAFGIGSVIMAAPACATLTNIVKAIPGPALISCTIMLILLVGLCADPKAGVSIGVPISLEIYGGMGVSAGAIGRIAAFSMSVLDSLPIAAGMPMIISMCDLEFKEGYKPVFQTTVLSTLFGTLAAMIVLILFPGLA